MNTPMLQYDFTIILIWYISTRLFTGYLSFNGHYIAKIKLNKIIEIMLFFPTNIFTGFQIVGSYMVTKKYMLSDIIIQLLLICFAIIFKVLRYHDIMKSVDLFLVLFAASILIYMLCFRNYLKVLPLISWSHFDTLENTSSLKRLRRTDKKEIVLEKVDGTPLISSKSCMYGITKYEYDGFITISKVIDLNGAITEFSFVYEDTHIEKTKKFPNGITQKFLYNSLGQLVEVTASGKSDKIISSYKYIFGNHNEIVKIDELERTIEYKYDSQLRLLSETITTARKVIKISYVYDSNGNRITKNFDGIVTEYTYDKKNQLTSEKTDNKYTLYKYDKKGRLILKILPDGETIEYYWSSNYNKSSLFRTYYELDAGKVDEQYKYDVYGNLIGKRLNGVEFTGYIAESIDLTSMRSNNLVLAEYNKDDFLAAFYTLYESITYNERVFPDNYSFEKHIISQIRDGKTYYYIYDGLSSVRMLIDENGNITDQYDYDSYGNLLRCTGTTENEFRFAGMRYLPRAGLYFYPYRRSINTNNLFLAYHADCYDINFNYVDPSTGRYFHKRIIKGESVIKNIKNNFENASSKLLGTTGIANRPTITPPNHDYAFARNCPVMYARVD